MPQTEPLPVSGRLSGVWRRPNSNRPKKADVHYPDSDGEPMGESFLHIELSFHLFGVLLSHHGDRAEDACVGCNNFVYYEEGNPKKVVTPDLFVAYGVPQRTGRRVFKVWEEGVTPDWVLEVTSKSTWREDEGAKRRLYERLGVQEYWQFDPTGEYLDPILKGRALGPDGRYVEFVLEECNGGLCHLSEVLGLDLRLEGDQLRFFDPARGEYLLSGLEPYIAIGEQRDVISEQRDVIEEQRHALQAAEARIRELERQRCP